MHLSQFVKAVEHKKKKKKKKKEKIGDKKVGLFGYRESNFGSTGLR